LSDRFKSKTKNGNPGHPISSVKILRGALVAQKEEGEEAMVRFAMASFHANWGELLDVSDIEVVNSIWKKSKLNTPWKLFVKRLNDPDIKDLLRKNTQEVIDRGGFGSPSIYISRPNNEPGFKPFFTWGNDRMELIEANMLRARNLLWKYHSRL
jgi:2-hydroxychromene-2-carboxylate isomerase